MNPLTRRSILALIGAAPAAMPSVARLAPGLLAKAELAATVAIPDASSVNHPGVPLYRVGSLLGEQLSKLRDTANREGCLRAALRVQGIDPDIAAIRSTSRTHKVRQQMARDLDASNLVSRIEELLWE